MRGPQSWLATSSQHFLVAGCDSELNDGVCELLQRPTTQYNSESCTKHEVSVTTNVENPLACGKPDLELETGGGVSSHFQYLKPGDTPLGRYRGEKNQIAVLTDSLDAAKFVIA